LHDWVLPRIGSQPLVDLNATRLRALYAELLESGRRDGKGGLSPRSVQYAHRILFHALKDATEAGLLSRNPASLLRAPRVPKREMKVWTGEEARDFLDALEGDRLYALWVLMITTGVRRGEALGLQWRDVDLVKGRLAI
jgi:integrase